MALPSVTARRARELGMSSIARCASTAGTTRRKYRAVRAMEVRIVSVQVPECVRGAKMGTFLQVHCEFVRCS